MRHGSRGPDVQRWQEFLQKQLFVLDADGIFGPQTEMCTRSFQRDLRVTTDDGFVGPATLLAAASKGYSLPNTQVVPETPARTVYQRLVAEDDF